MSKILRIALIVLLALSAIICVMFYAGGENIHGEPKFTDLFMIWAAVLTVVAMGLTIILPVIQMITHPENAKKGLIGVVALAVVIAIAYVMSSGELLGITDPKLVEYDTPSTVRYAGMMLNSIYLLAGLTILSMVYSEVSKAFK